MNRRQKVFALLKSLGMSNGDLCKMMSIESLYIGFYSALYGLIGSLVRDTSLYVYGRMMEPGPRFVSPTAGYFAFVGLDLVVALLFALYSVVRIRKVNLMDSMRSVD